MNKITVPARLDELDHVLDFIEQELDIYECAVKIKLQLAIAVEEIFVNIAKYAYAPGEGSTEILCSYSDEMKAVSISFLDEGMPYNPLAKKDPDITLSSEDRKIGGLGIYMVKKSMDEVIYDYKDNRNMLTIRKNM
jgi:Anti-sigma regulatory factor (Ser/Thr protein kinase)